jgi:hypothetical protein
MKGPRDMNRHHIVGVHITNRFSNAPQVQMVLTEHGCNIKTRLGLHEVSEDLYSRGGILLLELFGPEAECNTLVSRLKAIEGIELQEMVFAD